MNGVKILVPCCEFLSTRIEAHPHNCVTLLSLVLLSEHFLRFPHFETKSSGYDIVILSDLLHFHSSHSVLVKSLTALLSRIPTSRAYVAAGNYTRPDICDNFLRQGEHSGLIWEEQDSTGAEAQWLGTMPVPGLTKEQLAVRKNVCRLWVGRWAAPDDARC